MLNIFVNMVLQAFNLTPKNYQPTVRTFAVQPQKTLLFVKE